MNFPRSIIPFMTIVGIVTATTSDVNDEQPKQQLLRKAMNDVPTMDSDRKLQILQNIFDPCPIIEGFFPSGQVSCECNTVLLSGSIDYTCNWDQEICVGGATLGFCGTPVYSGLINLFQTNVQNSICIADVSAVGDLLQFDDFCVDLTVNPRNDKILTCTASFGDIKCNSCIPCTNGGLNLDCGNVDGGATDTCTTTAADVRTVTNVKATKSKKMKAQQVKIPKPFVPNFFN